MYISFLFLLIKLYLTHRSRERETRKSRSKGATTFFPDDVEVFTYPVFERMQVIKKTEKQSNNNQIQANGNQVRFLKLIELEYIHIPTASRV